MRRWSRSSRTNTTAMELQDERVFMIPMVDLRISADRLRCRSRERKLAHAVVVKLCRSIVASLQINR